jgi:hypothetical protein
MVQAVWDDMPGPRTMTWLREAASAAEVDATLDRAAQRLADIQEQWPDALVRKG